MIRDGNSKHRQVGRVQWRTEIGTKSTTKQEQITRQVGRTRKRTKIHKNWEGIVDPGNSKRGIEGENQQPNETIKCIALRKNKEPNLQSPVIQESGRVNDAENIFCHPPRTSQSLRTLRPRSWPSPRPSSHRVDTRLGGPCTGVPSVERPLRPW